MKPSSSRRRKEKIKHIPVLKNFTPEEEKILKKSEDERVWPIALFFEWQINEIWSQVELKILCLSDPKENHYVDPMESKGGQREQNLHLKISLMEHFSRELEALQRGKERFLNNPDKYGYCQECGKAIPLKRLSMVPQARLCVPCAEGK